MNSSGGRERINQNPNQKSEYEKTLDDPYDIRSKSGVNAADPSSPYYSTP